MRRALLPPVLRRLLVVVLVCSTPCVARGAGSSAGRDSARAREPIAISRLGEATLVELRIGHAATGTTLAYEAPNGQLMLRINDVLDLAEVKHRDEPGRINGQLSAGETFEVDATRHSIRHARQSWHVRDGELVSTNEGIVASIDAIARVFSAELIYDRSGAIVEMRNAESLPVARRVARLAAHAALRHGSRETVGLTALPPDWLGAMSPSVAPALVLDYDAAVTRQSFAPKLASRTAWTLNGGVNAATTVAGGQLQARFGVADASVSAGGLNWRRVWPEGSKLTTLELGEVASRGPETRVVQGFGISNAVVHTAAVTEIVPVSLGLAAGWDVEAWSSGKLVDAADGGAGPANLRIPVSSGVSAVDFVATDPAGEEHAFQRSFSPTPWFVAPGGLEYSLIAGACGHGAVASVVNVRDGDGLAARACDWGMAGDARYGLRQGWVLRGGFDGAHYAGASRTTISTPYVGVAGLPTRQLLIEALFAPYRPAGGAALTDFSVRFQPTPSISFTSSYEKSDLVTLLARDYNPVLDNGSAAFAATTLERASHRSTLLQISPRRWNGRYTIEGSENSQWWNGTVHSAYRVAVAVHDNGIALRPYIRADRAEAGDLSTGGLAEGIESTIMARGALASKLGSTWMRAVLEHGTAGSPQTEVSIGHASNRWRFDIGARRASAASGWTWTVSAAPILAALHSTTVASSSMNGSAASQLVRGSAVVDLASRRVNASAEPSSQRGGIGGVVFLDRNANGVRDADEPGLSEVVIRIGNRIARSDSTGQFEAWGIAALSDVDMSVDTTSLRSPWWTPARAGVRTRVPGNGTGRVDLPIVLGGIVQGRIDVPDSITRVGEFPTIAITNVRGGDRILVTPFRDGTFYQDGLRPGTYVITFEPVSAERSGLAALQRQITIEGDPASQNPSVFDVVLSVRRAAALGNLAP